MQSRHEAAESVPRIVPQLLCTTETQQTQLRPNRHNCKTTATVAYTTVAYMDASKLLKWL